MRASRNLLAAAAWLWLAVSAWAERVDIEPSASAMLTATNNAGLGLATSGSDLVVDVAAGLRVRAEGARVTLIGGAALESVTYTRHTQSNQLIPSVDLTGRWLAVEQLLFIEGSVRTTQTYLDPYGPALSPTTTGNNTTVTQYVFSPYIDSQPTPNLHLRARSDNTYTKQRVTGSSTNSTVNDSNFSRQSASLERDPTPWGWRLEAESTSTKYENELIPLESDIARALLNVTVYDTATVGLRFGVERGNFLVDPGWQSVYGGQMSWRPTDRTALSFVAEKRFFGNGILFDFTHRMPSFAIGMHASRDVDTSPQTLFTLGPTDNVAALLDAILTTRFPSPAQRAIEVQNIIARQGLPASTTTVRPILGRRLSVTESASLNVAWLGARSTLAFTASASRNSDVQQDNPFATGDAATNNTQVGSAVAYALRMTPTATAGLTLAWRRIRSLDTANNSQTTGEPSASAQLAVQLSTKTSGRLGAQYRRLTSDVADSGRESSVFVALDHRF